MHSRPWNGYAFAKCVFRNLLLIALIILRVALVIEFPPGVCSSLVDCSVMLFEYIPVHVMDVCLKLSDRPN